MYHPSFPTHNNDPSSKLARLARAKKRSKNTNTHMDSARKAQRVDYDMLESGDVLDGMSIIRYNAQVNCDVNTDEVNTSSTVTDIDGGTIPSVSTMTDMDGGTISNVSTMADSETVQDNLLSEGQQLQVATEQIMTLTHQNNVLQMECNQLMAANTELLQKSAALQNEFNKIDAQNKDLKASVSQALKEVRKEAFGYTNIEASDEETCHYTGLPTYTVFSTLFDLPKPFVIGHKLQSVAATEVAAEEHTVKNQFYATLVKLRHNVPMNDLAYRLHVTEATVSNKWLDVMYNNLKQLIIWPDSETLRQNLPSVFQTNFARVKCIIDCFEIFIERPVAFNLFKLQETQHCQSVYL